jgi:archaellum biogenesis ATPase FlaH
MPPEIVLLGSAKFCEYFALKFAYVSTDNTLDALIETLFQQKEMILENLFERFALQIAKSYDIFIVDSYKRENFNDIFYDLKEYLSFYRIFDDCSGYVVLEFVSTEAMLSSSIG